MIVKVNQKKSFIRKDLALWQAKRHKKINLRNCNLGLILDKLKDVKDEVYVDFKTKAFTRALQS